MSLTNPNTPSALRLDSLDNPAWEALTTLHAQFAEGDDLAKRYPTTMYQVAAVREPSDDCFRSLTSLLGPEVVARFFSAKPVKFPPAFQKLEEFDLLQMICPNPPPEAEEDGVRELTAEDVPEMLRLVELTKPGPFGPRTHEMGSYSPRMAALQNVRGSGSHGRCGPDRGPVFLRKSM